MDALHPAAIHAPLTLLVLWPLVDGLGLWRKSPHLMRLGFGLLGLATILALVATATGQAAFDVAVAKGVDPGLLRTHTDDADLLPWLLLALCALRAWLPQKVGAKGHAAALVLGLGLAGFGLTVGRSGGALVYEHGVGVWTEPSHVAGPDTKR